MKVTMDRVGRIVVPKALREQLGLRPQDELEATIDGHSIRLEPRATQDRVVAQRDGVTLLRSISGATVTDRMVRDLRDADQR